MFYKRFIQPGNDTVHSVRSVCNRIHIASLAVDGLLPEERVEAARTFEKEIKRQERAAQTHDELNYRVGEKMGICKGLLLGFAVGVLGFMIGYKGTQGATKMIGK